MFNLPGNWKSVQSFRSSDTFEVLQLQWLHNPPEDSPKAEEAPTPRRKNEKNGEKA